MGELQVETVGHVRVLRLDRPERKNALTSSLGWSVVRAVAEAATDDDVRVVAITGNGDAFCSGLDLGGGGGAPADTGLSEQQQVLDEKGWVGRFLLALRFDTDKPVIAGLNGVAVGAGLSLAMAADIRIAAHTARLVSEVVPAGELDARMLELCTAIAAQAPLAVQRTKRLVARTPLVTDVDARAVEEIRNALAGLDSEDGREAVQAIIEKRDPQFRGR